MVCLAVWLMGEIFRDKKSRSTFFQVAVNTLFSEPPKQLNLDPAYWSDLPEDAAEFEWMRTRENAMMAVVATFGIESIAIIAGLILLAIPILGPSVIPSATLIRFTYLFGICVSAVLTYAFLTLHWPYYVRAARTMEETKNSKLKS